MTKHKRLIIRSEDVIKIYDCSQANAARIINNCRHALNKGKHKPVTIREFCKANDLDHTEIENFIFPNN